jgi:hypothetical protein
MNHSVSRDLVTKYRAELSYTYELNMTGDARAARATFVDGSREGYVPGDDADPVQVSRDGLSPLAPDGS